jgi:hypothetical protein
MKEKKLGIGKEFGNNEESSVTGNCYWRNKDSLKSGRKLKCSKNYY